eukprot:TRINITY_DN1164_c0_g1_i3.p1 TRINITY_DN1164_c0_g1~~TRINITY_DN1164_c0_g1_i3.p1  ORF type:complete len:809 (-),score=172.87 TRINITY_DN1164_c0_g1_i3:614-3040(-)
MASKQADMATINSLLDTMREQGLTPPKEIHKAMLDACANASIDESLSFAAMVPAANATVPSTQSAKPSATAELTGDERAARQTELADKAEEALQQYQDAGHSLEWPVYKPFLETLVKAGRHQRVINTWHEMEAKKLPLGIDGATLYMQALCGVGDIRGAEALLEKLILAGERPLQSALNALFGRFLADGQTQAMEELVKRMEKSKCFPDQNTYHLLLSAYLQEARKDREREASGHVDEDVLSPDDEQLGDREARDEGGDGRDGSEGRGEEDDKDDNIKDDERRERENTEEVPGNDSQRTETGNKKSTEMNPWLVKAKTLVAEATQKGRASLYPSSIDLLIREFAAARYYHDIREFYLTRQALSVKQKLPDDVKALVEKRVGTKRLTEDEKRRLKLKPEQRELLVGVLLGGAYIETHDQDRTYEIHFEQGVHRRSGTLLLRHLYEVFADWAQAPVSRKAEPHVPFVEPPANEADASSKENAPRGRLIANRKPSPVHHFATVSHGSFRFYAHQWHPERRGKIPRLVHRWLSPRALAYWYMYGGQRCPLSGGILLHAKTYSAREIQLVTKALKARAIDCERRKRKTGDLIRFTGKSADWLWKLMEPFVLPSLRDELRPRVVEGWRGSEEEEEDEEAEDEIDEWEEEKGTEGRAEGEDDDDEDSSGGESEWEEEAESEREERWSREQSTPDVWEEMGSADEPRQSGEGSDNGEAREQSKNGLVEEPGSSGRASLVVANERAERPRRESNDRANGTRGGEGSGSDSDDETDWVSLADAVQSEKAKKTTGSRRAKFREQHGTKYRDGSSTDVLL